MPKMRNSKAKVLCRYCRFCKAPTDSSLGRCSESKDEQCDTVELDRAECPLGELCDETRVTERQGW